MAHIRINELGMTYPDSFHEMSEEEKASGNFLVAKWKLAKHRSRL